MISTRDLTKAYGGQTVVGPLSVRFPKSGCIALLGPSGCGKTTFLRLVSGLERPDGGAVSLAEHTRLSYIFQEDRLLPALTAKANIMAVLSYGSVAKDVLAEQWLGRVGLEGQGDKYPDQLSGGMKRRVAVARALAYGGEVLLMDEPFKGLDVETRAQIQELALLGHDARRRLNVLVTHDVEEALYLADRILLLDGPPLQIKDVVAVDIPTGERAASEDILMWHREYILRKLQGG